MGDFLAAVGLFICICILGLALYGAGVETGKQTEACKPGQSVSSIQDNMTACKMPDGSVEIRKY